MAVRRLQDVPAPAGKHPTSQVTIEVDHDRTLTPQQQAAWDWFVQEVRVRLARRRQQVPAPPEDPRP